jgi:hypothetical protein
MDVPVAATGLALAIGPEPKAVIAPARRAAAKRRM